MEDNDRTRNDEGPNWGTKDQSGNAILKLILSGLLASYFQKEITELNQIWKSTHQNHLIKIAQLIMNLDQNNPIEVETLQVGFY